MTKINITFKEWLTISEYNDKNPLSITELDCFHNYYYIIDLKGIEEFLNLKKLKCSNNNLHSLKNLKSLTKLEILECSYNKLTTLEGIGSNLKNLICSFNNLKSLKYVESNLNLNYLDCENNLIHDLNDIIHLKHLNLIYCEYNFLNCLSNTNFDTTLEYMKYLKNFYRKDKIKKLI